MPQLRSDITGVVLAGGRSARMGVNKALVTVRETPLIQHVARTLQCVFEDVVIIANDPTPYEFLGLPIHPDLQQGRGPMGGIHAALLHTGASRIFVLACDMPEISHQLVRHVAAESGTEAAAVAEMHGRIQPLCGVYSNVLLPEIESRLQQGEYKLKDLLAFARAKVLPITPALSFYRDNLLRNLNTPADMHDPVNLF